jgi:hypothetical protein
MLSVWIGDSAPLIEQHAVLEAACHMCAVRCVAAMPYFVKLQLLLLAKYYV